MDVFSRTFLPAARQAGVAIGTVSRHIPIFRRCVEADDPTVLVTRCQRSDRPMSGDHLLLLTRRRLIVTSETRVLHRMRLHLNTDLRHLSNISWNPDPRQSTVELTATAVDGVRERFFMRLADPERMGHVDALFTHVFRGPAPQRVERPAALKNTAPKSAALKSAVCRTPVRPSRTPAPV